MQNTKATQCVAFFVGDYFVGWATCCPRGLNIFSGCLKETPAKYNF
ncbi:MAG: hypothetical protein J5680_04870 [Neisseriaceae bacterium]|nr:hypothetical protein [Neisseriaceae bacterium]